MPTTKKSTARKKGAPKVYGPTTRAYGRAVFPTLRTATAKSPWQTIARALERLGEREVAVLVLAQPALVDDLSRRR